MDNFIRSNPLIAEAALSASSHLRRALTALNRLECETRKSKVQLFDGCLPELNSWVKCLAFMTRKICSLYLGETDYDYEFNDFNFSLLKRKEFENV